MTSGYAPLGPLRSEGKKTPPFQFEKKKRKSKTIFLAGVGVSLRGEMPSPKTVKTFPGPMEIHIGSVVGEILRFYQKKAVYLDHF